MPYQNMLKGRHSEIGQEYLITTVTYKRKPVFENLYASRSLILEMRRLEYEHSVKWLTWVVMPDHLHGLLSLGHGRTLSGVMNTLKGRSASSINKLLNTNGTFWQNGFHEHALRKEEDRLAIARYIVTNPLRAMLVTKIGDYPHWDSTWLE